MTEHDKPTILVVGAGVTGLTLACVLKRAGASLRIIDKSHEPLPFARACNVRSRTLEVFQDFGFADALVDRGQKIVGECQFANGERVRHNRGVEIDSPYPFSLGIEQWKTECLVEECLVDLGAKVERRTELVAIEERLDGVRATLRLEDGTDEVVNAPWLVGCDGAHSTVRHLNRQNFPGEIDPGQYIVADALLDPPPAADEIEMYLTDEGLLALLPLPEGRTLVGADVAEIHDGHTETPSLAELQDLIDSRGPTTIKAADPRWLSWYRIHYRLTPHYRHGRTFLAGDAAHVQSPFAGLGMNTGIQDAYNLGWKLALVSQGRAPESLLDSYEKERRTVARDMLALSKERTKSFTGYAQLSEDARTRLYRHAHVSEAEQRRLARHIQELDLDYRRSPVCAEQIRRDAAPDTGPHAGGEALDAGPLETDGRELSLFELISGPRHTLLLFVGTQRSPRTDANIAGLAAEVGRVYGDLVQVCVVLPPEVDESAFANSSATVVRDLESALHTRYGADATRLYLVRPDGYIGWRSDRLSLTSLRDYLAKVFTCPA